MTLKKNEGRVLRAFAGSRVQVEYLQSIIPAIGSIRSKSHTLREIYQRDIIGYLLSEESRVQCYSSKGDATSQI